MSGEITAHHWVAPALMVVGFKSGVVVLLSIAPGSVKELGLKADFNCCRTACILSVRCFEGCSSPHGNKPIRALAPNPTLHRVATLSGLDTHMHNPCISPLDLPSHTSALVVSPSISPLFCVCVTQMMRAMACVCLTSVTGRRSRASTRPLPRTTVSSHLSVLSPTTSERWGL